MSWTYCRKLDPGPFPCYGKIIPLDHKPQLGCCEKIFIIYTLKLTVSQHLKIRKNIELSLPARDGGWYQIYKNVELTPDAEGTILALWLNHMRNSHLTDKLDRTCGELPEIPYYQSRDP